MSFLEILLTWGGRLIDTRRSAGRLILGYLLLGKENLGGSSGSPESHASLSSPLHEQVKEHRTSSRTLPDGKVDNRMLRYMLILNVHVVASFQEHIRSYQQLP